MTKRDVEPSPVPPASEITLDLHALERIVIGAAKSLYHEGGMPEGFSRVIEALIAREDERRQAVAAETSRHEAFDKLTEVIDGIIEDAFMVAESHALAKPDAPQRDAVIACLVEDAVAAIRAAQSEPPTPPPPMAFREAFAAMAVAAGDTDALGRLDKACDSDYCECVCHSATPENSEA